MDYKHLILAIPVLCALNKCDKEKVEEAVPEQAVIQLEEKVISSNSSPSTSSLFDLMNKNQLKVETTGNFFQFAVSQTKAIASSNGYPHPTIATYTSTQEARPFLYDSLKPFLLNLPELLEGKIYRESSGDLKKGCNKQGACGPSQVTFSGMCTALNLLYSDTGGSKIFRDRDLSRIAKMRETQTIIDIFTSGYFSMLGQMVSAINTKREYNNKWMPKLKAKEVELAPGGENYGELANENQRLRLIRDMIREGYLLSNVKAQEKYNLYQLSLNQKGGTRFLEEIINPNLPVPEALLSQQEQIIRQMWELTKTVPYLNILLGDIALASEIDYYVDTNSKNPVREGLMAYNQGRSKYEERKEIVRLSKSAKRRLTPTERKKLDEAIRLIGRADGYQDDINTTRKSNVNINEALYGDGRLKCNFTDRPMSCSAPKATLRYIGRRKK